MISFGLLFATGFIQYFTFLGYLEVDPQTVAPALIFIALVCTLVESLPITKTLDDNLSVPVVAYLLGFTLFKNMV